MTVACATLLTRGVDNLAPGSYIGYIPKRRTAKMKIATITYNPTTLLEGTHAQGEGRCIVTGNLANAVRNLAAKGPTGHVVKAYRSGGIKDGWHHLNAVVAAVKAGMLPANTELKVEIHD